MSRKKKEERKTQKGKFKNKLCFLAAAIAAGTITTEDKKLYGGEVCTVRVNGVTTGNPTTLGSAPGSYAIACGDGAIANGTNSIATGKGAFTGYSGGVAIGENATAVRDSDVAIGTGAGLYNQGLNAKTLPNTTSKTRGYNVIIGANAMVGDDNNTSVHTSQGIAIGGSGTQRDIPTRKYGDSGGAWAKGDQSIAIGGDTIAEGHSSIAIGGDDLQKAAGKSVTYTLGSGSKTASLLTAMSDLAGVASGDITSFNATKSGSGAVALGVKSISGDLSLAIGTMSKANKVNATAVGTGAVADLDNSVAIGGGSTTANAAGTQETSATINGVTYSNFAGGSGTKVGDVVSLGKNGTFNRQIKNVAAGNISATSTDAVNGSQLYSVAQTLQDRFKYVSINSTETGNADNKGALATNSIAIGPNASTTVKAENAVVIGNGAKTTEQVMNPGAPTQWTKTGKNSVVIGNKAATNSEGSVAIGHEAKVDNTTGNSGSTIGRYKNDDNSTYMGTSLAQNNIYADPSYVGTQGIAIGANSYSDYQGMSMGVGARSKNLSLALGYFSNAEGTSSIATGVGAYAKGDNSISSGRQSSTISTGSVALGVAARGGSTADGGLGGSIAVGAASDATHEQAIAIGGITNANTATLEQGRGDNTQATAARATAIGANAKAQAESSIAFGTKASVGSAGTNAVAIGKDSSATVANGVALGSESKATTAAGVTGFDMADGRSNVYSGLAGTAKTANMAAVSVGDGANKTRQITGVAAGKEDTDAVNVAQLKSTNLKIAGNTTSGGADVRLHDQTLTVKGDGTYLTSTAAGNTITMELKQDVKDKIDNAATKKLDNLDPAGVQKIKDTAAWNVVANAGTPENVKGGDTVKFINGDNIQITQTGKDFTFATKKDVTFDSITINNGPKLSSTGIDAGNKTISNVANGTANSDAVNLGQLNSAINNATTTATSTEKVVASTAADNIATVAPSTGQNLGDKNATYEVSVSKTAVQNIAKDAAAWNVATNGGAAEKVEGGDTVNFVNGDNIEVTNTGKNITIATKRDATFDSVTINNGPKLSSTGVDADNKKITNVADGTVGAGSKDAVNGGQLHDVKTSVTNNTTALNNLKSNTISLGGDNGTTNTQALDKTGGIKFNVKGDGTYLTSNATGDDVKLDLTQATKDKINNAATNKLDNLDPAGVQKIKDTAAWNVVANAGTPENVKGGDTVKFINGDNIQITQTGKDFTFATKKDVTFDSITINNGPKLSSTGIDAGNKTISNVANGTANSDAVNLGQLNAAINNVAAGTLSTEKVVASTAADNIATVAPSTGQNLGDKNATYEVSVSKTAVQNIAKDAAAWNVATNGGAAEKVEGGDTVNFVNGDNIEVTNTGKNITIATKRDATFDSVTINNGPKLSSTGVDADNKKITNVADGTVGAGSKDAVNGGQLHDVKTSVTNNTTALNNLKSNTIKLSGDSTSTTAERLDKNGGIEFGVKSGDTHYLTSTATGTDITLDLTPDAKAKINKVATLSSNTISLGGDNGTTNTQALDKTGGIKFNVKGDGTYLTSNATGDDVKLDLTQATKDKINNAATNKLDNLDPAGVQKIKDTAAWNVVANAGTPENVKGGDTVKFINGDNIQITQTGKDFTFATKKDVTFDSITINNGPKLSSTGIDAGNKTISNVANGTANSDAVNLGQLNSAINNATTTATSTEKVVASTAADNIATVAPSTGQNLGDKNATYEVSVSKTAVQNIAKDAAAWNVATNGGAAEKVEGGDTVNFVNGDNIEVTNTGKDITIATKKDATFDSVTINNGPKLSSTGVDAGNKKITNVADGTVGAGSKDAVNGGQLHDVKTSVTNNTTALNNLKNNTISLGGDTGTTNTQTLDKTGGIKFNVKGDGTYLTSNATGDDVTLDLTQTTKDKINNAATNKLDNLDPAGVQKIKDTAAWNVSTNGGTAEKVEGGDTVNFVNGDNIEVTNTGKDITIATKKDATFDSVTINNGPKLSSTGVDAGNKKITNVADGTVGAGSKDAVNGGQLHDVKTSVTNNTTALNNLKNNTISLGGDTGTTNTQTLDKTGGIKFNVKGDGTYLTSNATGDDVTLDLTQTTKDKINNAATNKLDNLDPAGVQKIKDTAAWNVVANSGTAEKVQGGDTVKFINGDNIEITQAGKDFTFATKKDVTFDSVTINNGPKLSSTGIDAGNKKISNLADGTANNDAVNLGQLNNAINNATATATSTEKVVASTAADNIATVAPSTGQNLGDKNATYEVSVSKTAVQNIAKDAAAWNVSTNGGTAEKVEGGDTVNFVNGDNIEVTNTGKDITIATKKDATFDSVTINNGPKLSSTGVDAGNKKITNVADGTVGAGSKDAVNGGQLHDVKTSVTNNTNALNDLKSNTISLGGDNGTTNTQALDKTGGIKFNVKGDGTYLTSNATGDDVKLDLTQATKDKINNAATNKLDNLDPAGVQKIKDTAAWNVVANAGTPENVKGGDTVKFINGDNIQITQTGKDFTFATKKDVTFDSITINNGPKLSSTGIDAGNKTISNVANGTANSDAVNLGQLNAVKNSPITFGGDSGTDVDRKLGEKLNVKGGATGTLTNNNIAVEADGNDTLNIKLAENVDLGTNGSVKIGDSTLNNDGLTITGGPSITKTGGINAGGNKISNVAAGTANDDAVNVSQLNTAINNAGAAATIKYKANGGAPETVKLSDGLDFVNGSNTTATVGPNGVVKYDVNLGTLAVGADGKAGADGKTGADGTVGKDGIATTQDVAKAINSSAWKVTSTASTGTVNTPSVEDVKNGDTVKFDAGDNIEITQNGKDFTFATKKDVKFDSVTINNGGPKLSATGIDAANKKITNVANGDVTATSKDAVNGSQLYGLSKNTVTVSGDSTSTTPQTLDQNGGIKLGIKSGDTQYLTSTATGTDITLDLTPDAKAKINKVATLSSNTISLGGDNGTTNTQALDKTGGIKFNVKGDGTYLTSNATNDDVTLDLTQATKDKINNAATNKLDNLDPAGIQKIKDTAAWNVVANNGTAEKVEGGNTVKFIDGDNIAITQAGKDFTIATKRDVNFDSVTVPAGAGNVVINNSGINVGNNKITNVADGTIAPGSKDAVNGGQLHDVQNTINAGAFTVSANGGAKDRIAKDENIDFENADGNIAISYDATGNKFTYNLSPNLNLGPTGSLRIGDALLNNGGLTIVNGPSITSAGVDAGNKKVTNVADGTIAAGSKDAINGGQLHDVQTNLQTSINNNAQNIANNTNAINNLNAAVNNPITFTGDSGNNIDRKLGETLNIKGGATGNLTSGNIGVEADSTTNTLNVKLAENIDLGTNGSVKMGDTKIDDNGLTINGGPSVTKAGIDAGNKKVTNVANGDITATSKDAVNGSQLHGVADSIKNSIGGNTILNPDGTITTSNIGGTGQNNIHDAISAVNSAANQRTTVVAGDNIDVTVSTNATGGNEYTVATKRDIVVDSVSVANNGPSMNSNGINAGGKTISNLGAGVNPNDAVNVAQLDAVKNSPITFGADTGTDHAATLGSRVSITGDNKNITTSISGNNIQVAMSETPSFGTVNVNDANTGTITGASNVTLDNLDEDGTVGRVATEAQLAAVRNEVAGTKDIDNKLRGFKRGADAGTASAMAMAGIPQVINPGENAIGASISAYKQQTAVAVGYTRASKNGRAVLKISGSVNSNSELGFSLGFMKGWD